MASISHVAIRGKGATTDAPDKQAEQEAREWIEGITGEGLASESFGEALKDGMALCKVVNTIHPGAVRKIETSSMIFKQMENVSNFLKACRAIGVAEHDLFETVDLCEQKDLRVVVNCIYALGRTVQKNYPHFNGPKLGVKEANVNKREFSEEQLTAGKHIVGKLYETTMDKPSIDHSKSITFKADSSSVLSSGSTESTASTSSIPPPPIPSIEIPSKPPLPPTSSNFATQTPVLPQQPVSPPSSDNFTQTQVTGNDSATQTASTTPDQEIASMNINDGAASSSSTATDAAASSASSERSRPVSRDTNRHARKRDKSPVVVRGGGYGLDAELAQKAADKYDYNLEEEAQEWIEEVINDLFQFDFGDALKDGVMLCNLVNAIKPGTIKKINTSKLAFKQMENISFFLKACREFGVAEFDLFETVDLYEQKDLGVVVRCIHAFGRAVQKHVPDFKGPKLGVREASKNTRNFSDAQLQEARAAVPKMGLGSSNVMERPAIDRTGSNTFGYDSGTRN